MTDTQAMPGTEWRASGWGIAFMAATAVALGFFVSNVHSLFRRAHSAGAGIDSVEQIVRGGALPPTILWDLAGFAAALLVLHICVAFLGWLVARSLQDTLLLRTRRVRPWVIAGSLTLALFGWVYAANAALYPWSVMAGGVSSVARLGLGPINVFSVATFVLGGVITYVVFRGIKSSPAYARYGARVVVYPALLIASFGVWRVSTIAYADSPAASSRPHVVVIGIDSLRPDAVATGHAIGLTPNIDRFVAESLRFDDTITPLARTFPSWITILSGQHPVVTGARENLIADEMLDVPPTLADTLRSHGYRTVYATDEVRCSNIDRAYGFDEVVGPRMGALDFLLGTINDLPLSNLVANTPLGAALFPYTHANRAAAATYELATFVEAVAESVDFERPTFLAIHLTLPHFPYHWAGSDAAGLASTMRQPYLYSHSLSGVDEQVGMILDMLERKGALSNAIVVMLSDHGEAIGLPEDNLLRGRDAKRNARGVTVQMWGHGNSTLSPAQYEVLFAWRGFGAAAGSVAAGRVRTPASLEDVTPTILDLLGVPPAQPFDGVSLAPEVRRGSAAPPRLIDRVRYTETGIKIGFTKQGEARVADVVEQGVSAYEINPRNGRLELRPERYSRLLREKERTAVGRSWLLAAVPRDDGVNDFVALPKAGGVPIFLDREPGQEQDPELSLLWRGLFSRYGNELAPSQNRT